MADRVELIYNGVKYAKDVPPRDNANVQTIYNNLLNMRPKDERENDQIKAALWNEALRQERDNRILVAQMELEEANKARLEKDGVPNATDSTGGVENGDAGISQRRAVAPEPIEGATPVDSSQKGNSPEILTDAQAIEKSVALADYLNELVDTKDEDDGILKMGYVNKKITVSNTEDYLVPMVDIALQSKGVGNPDNQIASFFSRIDRFDASMVPPNQEYTGFTFITRPRLNLSLTNLVADDRFSAMRTSETGSYPFAIRCLLDTEFAKRHPDAGNCPLFDPNNAFNTLLINACKSISGFVDPVIETETTTGGFFSEDQTYVIGTDRLAKTYDLQCQFRDIPGGPVSAMMDYWCQYEGNLQDGTMVQYGDAIDANRLDYTVSIYRLVTDRTRRFITRWAKCTGCFPVNAPTGVPFNKSAGESMIDAAREFSINFKCNRIEYNRPIILAEFNTLVRRYAGWDSSKGNKGMKNKVAFNPRRVENNFVGLPYIRIGKRGYELVYLRHPSHLDELTPKSLGRSVLSDINQI